MKSKNDVKAITCKKDKKNNFTHESITKALQSFGTTLVSESRGLQPLISSHFAKCRLGPLFHILTVFVNYVPKFLATSMKAWNSFVIIVNFKLSL
jgi:hypothetical protein